MRQAIFTHPDAARLGLTGNDKNGISTRNEGSACLGGRICLVVKSLQNLSNVHIYQHVEMVSAPAGGQAGAARCCHRAEGCGLKVGLFRGFNN